MSGWLFPASPRFVVALLALTAVHWLVVPARARRHLLLAVSLAYAAATVGRGLALLLALVLFVHLRCGRVAPGAAAPPRLAGTLAVLLGVFLLLKLPLLAGALASGAAPVFVPIVGVDPGVLILPLGASYCLFRLVHYTVEVQRGRFTGAPLAELTLYVLFFPTLRAGPIERFDRFTPDARLTASAFNAGLVRIITGLLKKLVVADLLLGALALPWAAASPLPWAARQALTWNLVSLLLYVDFSGYTDIAIGASRLLGYRMVENFHYPYFKPNIAEYWRSWHISLHTFIRDYFFFPLFGRAGSFAGIMAGLFLSLVCSQIWHALSLNFALAGVYHGSVLVLWSYYDRWKQRRFDGPLLGGPGRVLGALLTLQVVSGGMWLFFWGRLPVSAAGLP